MKDIEYKSEIPAELPKLQKLVFGSSITQINTEVFEICILPSLNEIVFESDQFKTVDGIVYNVDQTSIILYLPSRDNKEFEIPSTITSIGEGAFVLASKLEKITINFVQPNMFFRSKFVKVINITCPISTLEESMFKNCTNLREIIIPQDSVITSINNECFSNCTSLEKLTFKTDLQSLGVRCFYNCQKLKDIDISKILIVEESCFEKCGVDSFNISKMSNLIKINSYAFMNTNISEVILPENVISIGESAFSNCPKLIILKFNEKIRQIGSLSFENANIKNVFIPNSLLYIDETAFQGCFHIEFSFSDEGHPIFHTYKNCFMNKADAVIFMFGPLTNRIPDGVKRITLSKPGYYRKSINSVLVDESKDVLIIPQSATFYSVEERSGRICVEGPFISTVSDSHDYGKAIEFKIKCDYLDPTQKYLRTGTYNITFSVDESEFDPNPEYFVIEEAPTDATLADLQNKNLAFGNFGNSTIITILMCFTVVLGVIIVCLLFVLFLIK